jgi:hypothetical protein
VRRRSPAGRVQRAVFAALVALVALVSTAAPAAAVTVGDYQKWRLIDRTWRVTPTGVLEIRLLGIFQGLSLANRLIERRGGRPLFCPTGTAELTGRTLREWVDDELESPSRRHGKPYPPKTAIEAVVLVVAMHRFPCKKTAPAK